MRHLLLAGLGAAAGLGQAPWGLWWLTLLALAGGLVMILRATRWRAAFLDGWALGFGYFLLTLHWIVQPFYVEADVYGWMAPFALFFMAGGLALFWAAAAAVARLTGPAGIWALALFLAVAEALRAFVFTGFPWVLLGHIWSGTNIAQLSALIGPHGLTVLTLGLAAALAGLIGPGRRWALLLPLVGLVPLWFALAPGAPVPNLDAPVVRLVQPNAPQAEKWDPARAPIFYRRMLDFTAEAPRADLVVWPETAIPYLLEYADDVLAEVAAAADGAPVVLGLNRRDETRYFNSLVVTGPTGAALAVYDKVHLVPFGEYVPAGELAASVGIWGLAASQGGGFSAGADERLIDLPGIGAARPLICYEGVFAEEIRPHGARPDLLLMITNDAWFGHNAGPRQHFAQARLRAIEQGLPMVRAANTGISAVIDGKGRVLGAIALGTDGWLDVALPPALPPTLYSRTGDWPSLLLLALAILTSRLARRRIAIDAAGEGH